MPGLHNVITMLLLPAALAAVFTTESFSRSEYWEQRVSLFELLPLSHSDIVFLGNSITDGGEFAELFGNPNVRNRGISGDVIDGVRERIDQVVRHAPEKIFLLIGINDISHNLSAQQLADSYSALVDEIMEKSPSTTLYIQSVMPINNDFGRYKNLKGKEGVVAELNSRLRKMAEKKGICFIDLHPALADSSGKLRREFTNDGLHLSGEGYKAWADQVRSLVNE